MSIKQLYLIEPTLTWQAAFLGMAAEFASANDHRHQAAITECCSLCLPPPPIRAMLICRLDMSRKQHIGGVAGTTIVGYIRLRHRLTPALEQSGGHIGYEVRPSKRRLGYGTQLLTLALERAGQMGLRRVLITCDVDNLGSARIIEKNGGKLADQRMVAGYENVISRYWIDVSSGD